MIFTFVDLELTQPSVKIIEIGAVAVDFRPNGCCETMSEFQTYCQPNESITEYITNLTGISDETVKDAPSIEDSLVSFWAWSKKNKTAQYVAWGTDMELIRRASWEHGVHFKRTRELDLKSMTYWFLLHRNMSHRGGLAKTMGMLGIDFDGVAHSALTDAKNTSKLGIHIFGLISNDAKKDTQNPR